MTAESVGWTFNPLVAIGIFLAFMFFGYFFGLYEGRGQGYKKRKQEEKDEIKPQPVLPENPPEPSDETPILNVSMGPDGQMRLELDGKQRNTSALNTEDRKRLIAVLTHIRPWLEAPKPSAPASSASTPPRPAQSQQKVTSPQGTRAPESVPHSGPPSLSDRIAQVAGTIPPPKPKPAPQQPPAAKTAAPASDDKNDKDDKPIGAQSIVMQIDSILQARLAGTALDNRGIRLQESPQGGVLVWVGVEKFEGVEEVSDPEINAIIRAAITEWEDKYTPGF